MPDLRAAQPMRYVKQASEKLSVSLDSWLLSTRSTMREIESMSTIDGGSSPVST